MDSTESPTPAALLERLQKAEAELMAVRAELAQGDALITAGLLSATVAHELRNLLTPIMTYAQHALQQGDDLAIMHKALERTVDGLDRAAEVIETTLETAMGRSSQDDFTSTCDLRWAIEQALDGLVRPPVKDGIDVDIHVPPGRIVQMRPTALIQVILNLSLNAIEAMRGHRGGALRFSVGPAGGGWSLWIEDSGPGLAPEVRKRLFQPFQRGSNEKGTGLGLMICKRLIGEAGGTLAFRSNAPKRGTTAAIQLPAVASSLPKAG